MFAIKIFCIDIHGERSGGGTAIYIEQQCPGFVPKALYVCFENGSIAAKENSIQFLGQLQDHGFIFFRESRVSRDTYFGIQRSYFRQQ